MALGMRCDTCGADVPSLGSLQMHQLRYHSARSAVPPPSGGEPAPACPSANPRRPGGKRPRPDGGRSRPGNGRSGAIAPLALAIVVVLSGGAFAATRSRPADAPTQAELQASVHRAVLTSADFPVGWTANAPAPAGDDSSAEDRALAECLGTTYEDTPTEAEAGFSAGGLTTDSDFTIASSVERARADFAALAGPAGPGCIEQVMRTVLDADKPADGSYDLTVTPADLAAGLPRDAERDAIGFRIAATFHRGKATMPLTFEAIMIRHDRIQASLTFTSLGSPEFPADLSRSLTDAVVRRLADPS
jgi:hypothetical protein